MNYLEKTTKYSLHQLALLRETLRCAPREIEISEPDHNPGISFDMFVGEGRLSTVDNP
jgi:hypothetical protein